MEELWAEYDRTDINRLCIDIPIGLPTGSEERSVDKQCRSYLDRTSTVFRVPVREALEAEDYEEANKESRRITRTDNSEGKGVQPTAYAIRNQILDVNNFIRDNDDVPEDIIYEVHPELCFGALLGEPPQYSKKTAHGVAERIEALDTILDNPGNSLENTLLAIKAEVDDSYEIVVDDVIDALVTMYTAAAPESEFHLLEGDEGTEPAQRMAYRSPLKLEDDQF